MVRYSAFSAWTPLKAVTLYGILVGCERPDADVVRDTSRRPNFALDSVRVVEIAERAYRSEHRIESLKVLGFTLQSEGWTVVLGPADINAVGEDRAIVVRRDGTSVIVRRGQ